jgi:hypothetical protein
MSAFSDWYFSWGWALLTVLGFLLGYACSKRRTWGVLVAWLALVMLLGMVADLGKTS